jgi:hypothetical protein
MNVAIDAAGHDQKTASIYLGFALRQIQSHHHDLAIADSYVRARGIRSRDHCATTDHQIEGAHSHSYARVVISK